LKHQKKLGYKLHNNILSLIATIAVIISDINNDFFAQVLNGLEDAATKNNYRVITWFSNESHVKEVPYLSTFKKNLLMVLLLQ
jgi:DNA-binding LacI/PurR family transcriptional regulator